MSAETSAVEVAAGSVPSSDLFEGSDWQANAAIETRIANAKAGSSLSGTMV